MAVEPWDVKLDWGTLVRMMRWGWRWSHVRKTLTHGVNFAGQLGVFHGEGGDGFFESISGGTAGSVFRHGSRSDQLLRAEERERDNYTKLILGNDFSALFMSELSFYTRVLHCYGLQWQQLPCDNRITALL